MRVWLALLLAACGSEPTPVRIRLITPVQDDPTAAVERYVFSARHPEFGPVEDNFAADEAPFVLPDLTPGDGWVFELEGLVAGGSPIAFGRSCPTRVPADNEPVLYFSLLRQFSVAGTLDAGRVLPALLPLQDGDALLLGGDPAAVPARYARSRAGFEAAPGPSMGVVQTAPLAQGYLAAGASGDAWLVEPDGTITVVSAPEVARSGARLTALGDGRVLLTGGSSAAGPEPGTWIFDPQRAAFDPGPTLVAPRLDHTASNVSRHRALVLGGVDAVGQPMAAAELVSAVSASEAGPLGLARQQHTATVLEAMQASENVEAVLVAGGLGAGGAPLRDAEIYLLADPAHAEPIAERMVRARAGHTATPIAEGRFVLLAGGLGEGGAPVATAELYDVARRQFRPTDDMKAPRAGHAALVLCDDTIVFVGGQGDGAESAEIYNPDPNL
jgi:galactose oxidase-like protein